MRILHSKYTTDLPPQHTTESGIRPSIIPTSVPVTLSRSLTPTTTTLRPSTGSSASATGHVTGTGSRPTTTPERLTGFTSETTSTAPRSVSTSPTVTTSGIILIFIYIRIRFIRGLTRGMANLPQGNQELLVVRDKVGTSLRELGVSKSMECDNFPFSALTLLVGRQEGRPVCKKDMVLVCWW